MNPVAEDILMHYGVAKRSGRYPYGSGGDPYQRTGDFLSRVEELKKQGWEDTPSNIKEEFGLTTTNYRTEIAISNGERRMLKAATAKSLREDGKGYTEIGKHMGIPESSVRSLLNEKSESRMLEAKNTADIIKAQIDKKGMIDVGVGVERELGVSKEKLAQSLYLLERQGYELYNGRFPQATNPGQWTTQKVICPPGTPHKAIYDLDKVHTINDYTSRDGGKTFETFTYPKSMDSKRLMIRYKEDGGIEKDGIVELRRNVEDISLGDSRYSQVRILVNDKNYIKGMAVYSDNMPPGVDVIFNTNKTKDVPMEKVLKTIKEDPDNPFGSLIKANGQRWYTDADGNKQLSLINKRADEGDWSDWKDALPSQFLAKQSLSMAKKQLNLAKADKQAEYDDIMTLNNPTIKKHLLAKFADSADSAAVHLKAAALPGQKYHVLIPISSLKDTEVYAPGYENGTKVALIRYPHGGTFEIPILTVNNKHAEASKLLSKDITDAIGINSKVAERLSGADFDGDTAMVIPTHDTKGRVKITSTPPLKGLEGFDPKAEYPEREGMSYMSKKGTQTQMGVISNLITDMTLDGATPDKLARAVRHSMVVIDAEKHKLDYKKSEMDNNISALKKEYQRSIDANGEERVGGASTILSRSKGEVSVDKRQGTPKINMPGSKNYDPSRPDGSLLYKTADDLYYPTRKYNKTSGIMELRTVDGKKVSYDVKDSKAREQYEPIEKKNDDGIVTGFTNKDGTLVYKTTKRTEKSNKMSETDDAMSLVSKTKHPMEIVYADYANAMKSLANSARKELMITGKIAYDSTAKNTYKKEVSSLMGKLNTAELNTTRERAAQRKANAEVSAKRKDNPNMDYSDVKKDSQRAINKYRNEVGSVARRDRNIDITDREWEAIQAGAISESQLKRILNNTDTDKLRERATPKTTNTVSKAQINRIKSLQSSNYTIGEIAKKLGISTSSVSKYLKESA